MLLLLFQRRPLKVLCFCALGPQFPRLHDRYAGRVRNVSPIIDLDAGRRGPILCGLLRLDRSSDQDDLPPRSKGQTRPVEQRFLLKVDGQFKCSFGSEEAAKTADAAIKKAYPVVAVTVVDSQEHKTEAINV